MRTLLKSNTSITPWTVKTSELSLGLKCSNVAKSNLDCDTLAERIQIDYWMDNLALGNKQIRQLSAQPSADLSTIPHSFHGEV